jgi:hypothetical protein
VTKEQLIVIGFLAAAFVTGWLARALIARGDRGPVGRQSAAVLSDEDLERAVEATRKELDRAVRSHVAAVALSLRARDGEKAQPGAPAPEVHARPDALAGEVSAALQDDAANESMLSGMNGRAGALTEQELDLADWGFAYGVAWARARERHPGDPGKAIAREALHVAEVVFRAYAAEAEWSVAAEQRRQRRDA